jgi:hypothetical protein
MTSFPGFCDGSSTVPDCFHAGNTIETVSQTGDWGHCYRRGPLAAGCTGRRAGGAEVGHDRCGCVGHNPSGGALRKASAATDEAAAARRDAEKRCAYNRLAPNGCPLVPYWLETYSHLGKQVVALLGMLDAKAAAVGDISKSGLVTTALRECRFVYGQLPEHRASLRVLAGVAGWGFCLGADWPVEDVCSRVLHAIGFFACLLDLLCLHSAVVASGAIVLSSMSFK